MLGKSLFRNVALTKNTADFDKYNYAGNGIGFDACGTFSVSHGNGFGKNLIIFGANMSSPVHVIIERKIY